MIDAAQPNNRIQRALLGQSSETGSPCSFVSAPAANPSRGPVLCQALLVSSCKTHGNQLLT